MFEPLKVYCIFESALKTDLWYQNMERNVDKCFAIIILVLILFVSLTQKQCPLQITRCHMSVCLLLKRKLINAECTPVDVFQHLVFQS